MATNPLTYTQAGIPLDPPGTRLSRLSEAVQLIKRVFTEESVDFDGVYYSVRGLSLKPRPVQRPWPPLLVGGGQKRVLEFAARETDIVGIGLKIGPDGWFDWTNVSPQATAEKVHWVREAAGDRFPELELNWMVFCCTIIDDLKATARTYLESHSWQDEISVEDLLASPIVLVGSEDAIVELLQYDIKSDNRRGHRGGNVQQNGGRPLDSCLEKLSSHRLEPGSA